MPPVTVPVCTCSETGRAREGERVRVCERERTRERKSDWQPSCIQANPVMPPVTDPLCTCEPQMLSLGLRGFYLWFERLGSGFRGVNRWFERLTPPPVCAPARRTPSDKTPVPFGMFAETC